MKIDNAFIPFLKGHKFTSDLKLPVPKNNRLIERVDCLENNLSGKSVIHLGFADHLEIIPEKIKNNTWLHNKIIKWSSRTIGIDINKEAVELLSDKFDIDDIFYHDILSTELHPRIISDRWDILLMGEILEHINNPVAFLAGIKERYQDYIEKIVITVPNAFSIIELKAIWKNHERINSDHKYWFTPYTLSKVVTEAGLIIEEYEMCNAYLPPTRVEKFLLKRKPLLNHCIVMTAKFK